MYTCWLHLADAFYTRSMSVLGIAGMANAFYMQCPAGHGSGAVPAHNRLAMLTARVTWSATACPWRCLSFRSYDALQGMSGLCDLRRWYAFSLLHMFCNFNKARELVHMCVQKACPSAAAAPAVDLTSLAPAALASAGANDSDQVC